MGDFFFLPKLSALFVKSAPPGKYEDGNGLRLVKREDGGGQWVLRYTIHERRREMGLGGLASLSLKDARELASECRTLVVRGIDPIEHRRRERLKAVRDRYLLRDVALDAFESRKADLKGDGKAGRWFSPLELHILPKLGKMPVAEITQAHIRDALEPIWQSKASTADKAADTVFSALQFDDDEVGISINPQKIDATARLVPLAILFGYHQRVGRDDFNVFTQQPLQIATLV